MENKSLVARLVVMGEKTWKLVGLPAGTKKGAGVASNPSRSGQELQGARPVPTRVVMLAEQGAEQAGWESCVADDIEGEPGSKERSQPASSEAAFAARIRYPTSEVAP